MSGVIVQLFQCVGMSAHELDQGPDQAVHHENSDRIVMEVRHSKVEGCFDLACTLCDVFWKTQCAMMILCIVL